MKRLAALIGIMSFCLLCRADQVEANALITLKNGRNIFRFDTFGDEEFWGDTLKLHLAVAGEKLGGIGPGVSPQTALTVGLKVDRDALPQALVQQLKQKQVDLNDPATTVALLKLDAVVGVKAFLENGDKVRSVGITCAICHSTVDDSFAPGIGHRLDGWANRDLNIGKIISLAPNLTPSQQESRWCRYSPSDPRPCSGTNRRPLGLPIVESTWVTTPVRGSRMPRAGSLGRSALCRR